MALHSQSKNYNIFLNMVICFFSKDEDGRFEMKTPTFRRVRKNMIKKLKNIVSLFVFV